MLAILAAAILSATISKPTPKNLPPSPIPQLTGECQFGKVENFGRDVTITGGGSWSAKGEIRRDGILRLTWTGPGGRLARGLYNIGPDSFDGIWAWEDESKADGDGNIFGDGHQTERFWRRSEINKAP